MLEDHTIFGWGDNKFGQLGDGTNENRKRTDQDPVEIVLPKKALCICAGWDHSAAVVEGGGVFAWGRNHVGQLGDGSMKDRWKPTPVTDFDGEALWMAVGRVHNLVLLTDGSVLAWGDNEFGQLGDSTTKASCRPARVRLLTPAPCIAAGGSSSLAVLVSD